MGRSIIDAPGNIEEGYEVIEKTATFSIFRKYRYVLWRWWDQAKQYALFIGLNPSTADETNDDPTIQRCMGFARTWGYGGLCMMNLFAYRATDPKEMMKYPFPIGPENDRRLIQLSRRAGIVIACWGTKGTFQDRSQIVCAMLKDLKCLGTTKTGQPRHPLYLARNIKLRQYRERPI